MFSYVFLKSASHNFISYFIQECLGKSTLRFGRRKTIVHRTMCALPEAISAGGLTPTTDTSLFLTTYRGGSHLPADIYADNQFMKDYLEQQNTFDEGAFIVADGAYSGEENSQIAALDFQKLLDYINSLNNCAPKIETA